MTSTLPSRREAPGMPLHCQQIGPTDPLELALLNACQRDFPLVPEPFEALARVHGLDADWLRACCSRWLQDGVVSRIGAVLAAGRVGASTLAALRLPAADLDRVAAAVSAWPEVNHNYQREHAYNLWFVVTAAHRTRLAEILGNIAQTADAPLISLPLEEAFHIDLGFDLGRRLRTHGRQGAAQKSGARPGDSPVSPPCPDPASPRGSRLLRALQDGLVCAPRPFRELAERAQWRKPWDEGCRDPWDEEGVLATLGQWLDEGVIKRFGAVVRHHELGYQANAMCVWDVPDALVGALGRALATRPGVSLCYRRCRAMPHWPYNLFCMLHGRDRDEVLARRAALAEALDLDVWPHDVLFSGRRYKQQGARYLSGPIDAPAEIVVHPAKHVTCP